MPFQKLWNEITYEGRRWFLNADLPIKVCWEDQYNCWRFESQDLGIKAWGDTQEEGARRFSEGFALCWDEAAVVPAEQLSHNANILKKKMLVLVEKVSREN